MSLTLILSSIAQSASSKSPFVSPTSKSLAAYLILSDADHDDSLTAI